THRSHHAGNGTGDSPTARTAERRVAGPADRHHESDSRARALRRADPQRDDREDRQRAAAQLPQSNPPLVARGARIAGLARRGSDGRRPPAAASNDQTRRQQGARRAVQPITFIHYQPPTRSAQRKEFAMTRRARSFKNSKVAFTTVALAALMALANAASVFAG